MPTPIGVAIGLPFGGRLVHPKWAIALKTVEFPVNSSQTIISVEEKEIAEARNEIVKTALQNNCKYLFFLDDDVIIPRQTAQALGYLLDHYKDEGVMVSTGIYCTKTFAPYPVIYRDDTPGGFLDWKINEVFDIDSCGAGCMMINTEVFSHLEYPYFRNTEEYKIPEVGPKDEKTLHSVSEDIYFCRSIKAAGFKIKAHGSVICPHYDNATNKFYTLPEDSLPVKRYLKEQKEKENTSKKVSKGTNKKVSKGTNKKVSKGTKGKGK